MRLTPATRRIHESYEHARELEAAGGEPNAECSDCGRELGEGDEIRLDGALYCARCAVASGADLLWSGWLARPIPERYRILDAIEEAVATMRAEVGYEAAVGAVLAPGAGEEKQ